MDVATLPAVAQKNDTHIPNPTYEVWSGQLFFQLGKQWSMATLQLRVEESG